MRERYKKSLQASAIACLFFYPEFATPQSVTGIAFVEAPEQSSGWCTGSNAGDAIACAREKCVAGGVTAEDCKVMQYCYPSLWAADLFQQHKQGLHWHRYLCGWQSEGDLDAAIETACDGSVADYLAVCEVVAKWSPDGARIAVAK